MQVGKTCRTASTYESAPHRRTPPHRLLQLLTTIFAPRQERLKQDFRIAVERDGFLTREPFVSMAPPYKGVPALTELLAGDAGTVRRQATILPTLE
jgi:hypothetical protein